MSENVPRSHVVGSLLRPRDFLDSRTEADASRFSGRADRAVDAAIALQEQCGIDIITDGEQRRELFQDSLGTITDSIGLVPGGKGGIVIEAAMADHYANGGDVEISREHRGYDTVALIAPLSVKDPLAVQEYVYANSVATRPVKVTFPSPSVVTLTYWSPTRSTQAYPDVHAALGAWTDLLRQQVDALARAGCRYIQFDAPDLTFPIDSWTWVYEQAGFTRTSFLEEACDALNAAADHPDVTFSLHVCRGNDQGRWHTSGGYQSIAETVFRRVPNIDYIFLEYDSDRAGGFEPLARMPDDKIVVLGLVSTKTAEIESAETLRRRIDEAARWYARDQLAVSPQCGFASVAAGNPIDEVVQRAKLELVSEVAREVWA